MVRITIIRTIVPFYNQPTTSLHIYERDLIKQYTQQIYGQVLKYLKFFVIIFSPKISFSATYRIN